MTQQPSQESMIGSVIDGKYRVEALMGQGGMGRVFKVTHLQLNKTFALKLMNFSKHADASRMTRFKREAESLAKINHPNVVSVTDYGVTEDGVPYIVMEFILGKSLRQLMREQGKLTERQSLHIARQVCAGLYAAHLQGIVHRDLKPENIMIQELVDGELVTRVLDFSIAKVLQSDGEEITNHEELLGTLKYMTPEQFLGNPVDVRSDIFGICLIIYEMLSGVVPPATMSMAQPLISLRSDVNARLSQILERGLQQTPEGRFQSALELKRELESLDPTLEVFTSERISRQIIDAAIDEVERKAKARRKLDVGETLSHYQIMAKLGQGGMGEVYLAEDRSLGRKVALKLLPVEITRDETRVYRFEQEARAASALNHPNILTIYEIDRADGVHFIATEFIDGETLRQRMVRERMKLRDILDVALQAAGALAVAHPAGIIHRDIKPENIMLREDGYVKVLDFGLAKFTEQPAMAGEPEALGFDTDPGKVMGTPKYMSPEQARGLKLDARTDIFSLGIVLYEMVTGRVPFEGSSAGDIMAALLKSEPLPLTSVAPEIPAELERIVGKALRKDREERYQNVKDLMLDLKSLKQQLEIDAGLGRTASGGQPIIDSVITRSGEMPMLRSSVPPVPKTAMPEPRQRYGLIAAALILTLLVSGLGYYYYANQQSANKGVRTLAILPFRNLKPDNETDYLSFSLADAIITKLGYVRSLTVRPSNSVERYRNMENIEIKKVAAELRVNTVLTGTYQKEGEDLRITVQLIDVASGEMLWRDTLDLKSQKLLTIQNLVADQIVNSLQLELSTVEAASLNRDVPRVPLAYEYFLRGRSLMAISANNFRVATELFEKSVALDPNFARSWAYLGWAYTANATSQFGGLQYYQKAEQAYEKARALDPESQELRVFLAIYYTDTARVEEAIPLLRQVIKTNPENAAAHWELSYSYRYGGMLKESIAEGELALQLDQRAASRTFNSYIYAGQYEKFLESLPELEEAYFLFYRGLAYYYLKDYEHAAEYFNRAHDQHPDSVFTQIGKAMSYAIAGKQDEGLKLIRETFKHFEDEGVKDGEAMYKIAQAHAVLGDSKGALKALNRSIQLGFFCYPYFVSDELLEKIRHEPGLPEVIEMARKRHEEFKKKFF